MFYRNKGEIDFLIKKDDRLMPVEVKYQKNAGISDIYRLDFDRNQGCET